MRIIKPGYEILDLPADAREIYRKIERAGRTCYKSEDKITPESSERFVRAMVKNHHEAMLEHASMTVVFTVDRGVSHESVRHRMASFAQESTRYCRYADDKFGNEITVIEPVFYKDISDEDKATLREWQHGNDLSEAGLNNEQWRYLSWYELCLRAEQAYISMLNLGATPEEARSVLPTSMKTELVVTANMREWRHILNLRAAGVTGKPHPQMVEVMVPLLKELQQKLPALFEDIKLVNDV